MLPVNGGAPYEKDVAVEASVTRGCKKTQQNSAESKTELFTNHTYWQVLECMHTVSQNNLKLVQHVLELDNYLLLFGCFFKVFKTGFCRKNKDHFVSSHLFSAPAGVFQQMLHARRQPKLIVKLKSANNPTRTQLRWGRRKGRTNNHKALKAQFTPKWTFSHSLLLTHPLQSPSRHSAALSELCRPAGSTQAAAGWHTPDGQAYHAECRYHTTSLPLILTGEILGPSE